MKPIFVHFSECEFNEDWEESPTAPQPTIWYNYTALSDKAHVIVTNAHDPSKKTRYEFKKGSTVLVNATIIKFNIADATKQIEVCLSPQQQKS